MNKEQQSFSIKKRLKSFGYAINGLITLLKSEHNTWIHLFATMVVIIAGFIFHISVLSWFMIVVAIALVWITEAINTAIESIVDLVSPEFHPLAKKAKDVAAAAVLIAAIIAVIIGFIVVYNETVHLK